jgi:hypothetical protein
MPSVLEAEVAARGRFETTFVADTGKPLLNASIKSLGDGKSLEFTDFWDTRVGLSKDYVGRYAAIGRSSVHSEGVFGATLEGNSITIGGEVTHRLGANDLLRPGYYRDVYDSRRSSIAPGCAAV